jgi:hypothetical protein
MTLDLLALLGIPRVRIGGLSVLNFVGTFLVVWVFQKIPGVANYFSLLELYALSIPMAAFVHYVRGENTPLVRLARTDPFCFAILVDMVLIALAKHAVFYVLFATLIFLRTCRDYL